MPHRSGWTLMLLSGAVLLGGAPVPPLLPSCPTRAPRAAGTPPTGAAWLFLRDMRNPYPRQACGTLPGTDTKYLHEPSRGPRGQAASSRSGHVPPLLEAPVLGQALAHVLLIFNAPALAPHAKLVIEVEQLAMFERL